MAAISTLGATISARDKRPYSPLLARVLHSRGLHAPPALIDHLYARNLNGLDRGGPPNPMSQSAYALPRHPHHR